MELKKLSYAYDALEPIIDKETMEIHHTKHHQAYLTNFLNLVKGTEFEDKDLLYIIENTDQLPSNIKQGVRNNLGGFLNHNLFFNNICAGGMELTDSHLHKKIVETFGSVESLKNLLVEEGMKRFGSGFVFLVSNHKGDLEVRSTANQDSPYMDNLVPVLAIDVWEHAYYLKYQNRRKDYLDAIINLINWEEVSKNYKHHTE